MANLTARTEIATAWTACPIYHERGSKRTGTWAVLDIAASQEGGTFYRPMYVFEGTVTVFAVTREAAEAASVAGLAQLAALRASRAGLVDSGESKDGGWQCTVKAELRRSLSEIQ